MNFTSNLNKLFTVAKRNAEYGLFLACCFPDLTSTTLLSITFL